MRDRALITVLLGSVLLASCREPAPAPEETKEPVEKEAEKEVVVAGEWREMTGSWKGVEGGEVVESEGLLRLGFGESLTAARWEGEVPRVPFEVEAEARRVEGADFFYGLTFPGRTAEEAATLIVGGWGGGLVGISSIDGRDASENEGATYRSFEKGRWYAIRLRVGTAAIEAWIDGERVIDVTIEDRELSLRSGPIDACLPFGLATWETEAEVRGMRWRPLIE